MSAEQHRGSGREETFIISSAHRYEPNPNFRVSNTHALSYDWAQSLPTVLQTSDDVLSSSS
jgi:hypothetical protein